MTPEPLVSVVIPTYNRSSILYNTIKNVLNQTWEDIQLIIVDDYSSDDTKKPYNQSMIIGLNIKRQTEILDVQAPDHWGWNPQKGNSSLF